MEVSRRLQSCVRTTDTVCRLTGDEFTVILEGADHMTEVDRICGRIVDKLSLPQELKDCAVAVSSSVGVAVWEMGETPESVCVRADKAMYAAKHAGKGRYVLAESGCALDLLMTPGWWGLAEIPRRDRGAHQGGASPHEKLWYWYKPLKITWHDSWRCHITS